MNQDFNNQNGTQNINQSINNVPINNQPIDNQQPVQNNYVQQNQQVYQQPINQQPVYQQPMQQPVYQQQPVYNQPVNYDNVPQTKKKSKLPVIIALLLVLAAIGGGAYYFFFSGNFGGSKTNNLAKKYINNLINKKYEANYDLVFIPEDAYVTKNDYLDYAQKQTKYADISKKKIVEVNEVLLTLEDGKYEVVLKDDKEVESKVTVEIKKVDSDWKVVENSFFIKNWAMIIPKNTALYIDETKVDEKNIVEDSTLAKTNVKYVISAITSTKKQIRLENPLQTKELEVTPLTTNSGDTYKIELNDTELVNKALTYVKDTWNNIYADYIAKTDISDVKTKYFDESVDINLINAAYKDGLDAISAGSSGYKYVNYNVVDIATIEDKPCYASSDKVITLNFKYKMTYNWEFSYDSSLRVVKRIASIKVIIDGDSFKIYDINDEKLFSSTVNDYSVKDWN